MPREHIPNALTIARLVLAGVFIAMLSVYRFPDEHGWVLPTSIAIFIVAALTDALDGFLARRWRVISVFGRVMDPVADKVLVLGAFVMLAGPGFADRSLAAAPPTTGVLPWMAVVILSRELLVTSIRGVLESQGVDFSASWSGKLKMIVQAIGVPLILLGVFMMTEQPEAIDQLRGFNNAVAWGVTAVTAVSIVPYLARALEAAGQLRGGAPS